MGLKGRIRKLEEERRSASETPCEACGGVIIIEEIQPDGSVRYPHKEPCSVCGSRGSTRAISRIVIDARGSEGKSGRGNVYELVPFDEW
jgi:hypothetical protein